jgi:hypothetical protein
MRIPPFSKSITLSSSFCFLIYLNFAFIIALPKDRVKFKNYVLVPKKIITD